MAFLIGNQRTASINCSYMDFTILYLSPCQIDADWVGNITTLLLLLLSVRVRHFANFSTFSSTHFKTASRTASFTPSQLFYFITNSLTLIIHFFCQLLLFIFQLCHIPKNKINFVTFVTLWAQCRHLGSKMLGLQASSDKNNEQSTTSTVPQCIGNRCWSVPVTGLASWLSADSY